MIHMHMGAPCPKDSEATTRVKCSDCPHFVSYRNAITKGEVTSIVGCNYGADVPGWLRREFGPEPKSRTPLIQIALIGIVSGLALSLFDRKETGR